MCFYDVPDRGYWRFQGQGQYTFDNSGSTSNYDQDLICIGYNGYDSSARFYAITLKTRHLTIGGDTANGGAAILKHDMTGHLVLDDLNNDANGYLGPVNITTTLSCDFYKGDLYATNANITCQGDMTLYNFTAEKTGGDWLVTSNIKMNPASGNMSTFYHRDGNLVVANDLVVQNTGFGEFYMEGGHVTVSNIVRFANNYLSSGNKANLYLTGGVFEAKAFRFHNCDYSTGNVIFNGGTYKALADGDIAVHEGRMGYNYLRFKVGTQGGTIDTAGHDVISPFQLLKDDNGSGGLVVKGGGSLTLSSNTITYNSKTFLEAGTLLAVSNNTAAANILANGIELIGTPALNTDYTVFVCNKELTESDLDNVNCATAEITKSLGADGKSIVVRCTAAKIFEPRYIGPANGSLSDAANWSPAVVPTSGNAYIPTETAANLTVGDTFRPSAITFLPGSAAVTISGTDLANIEAVTNLSFAVQTFANSVTFKDAYRVYCDGYAVNFTGGATATCPAADMVDNAASHMLMGNITFTNDWNCDYTLSNPYSVPNGSSLYGTSLTGTRTQIVLSVDVGGYAEFADNVYTGPNCGRVHVYGEMVVKGRWIMKGTGASAHVGFDGDAAGNGIVRANGIWKGDESNNMDRNCYIKPPYIYIGSDGLGAKSSDYAIHFDEGAHTVYATDDFEIFGNARTGYLWDWGLSLDNPTTFNTQGYTINWTAGADGSGTLVKDGEGTLIFNPYGTRMSGAVTVKGGTLKVMSASGVSTGATTVKDGATLEVASGAKLGTSPLTLEAGSTLIVPSADLPITVASLTLPGSGTATIRIAGDAAYADGDYEVLSVTGGLPAGFADKINIVLPDGTSENRQLYTTDNGTMRLMVGSGDLPYTWTGAACNGMMNTPGNWLGGKVPPTGATVFIPPSAGAIVNDIENFAPASITIGYGSELTISGNAITNVVAITNLSTTTSHTINAPVYFAGDIQVKQDAMAEVGNLTKAHVTFAGGAYAAPGCAIENGNYAAVYSRCMFGKYYLASTSSSRWTAAYQNNSKRVCLADNSSLYIPYAGALTELYIGTGAKVDVGDMAMTGSARFSYQNRGEMVVTNATMTGTGDRLFTYNQDTTMPSVFKFHSITNKMTNNWILFGDGNKAMTITTYIGAGGLNFEGNDVGSCYCLGAANKSGSKSILRAWNSDFTIQDCGAGKKGLAFDHDVEICTDDEDNIGRIITVNAETYARNSPTLAVSGSGTLQVNNGVSSGSVAMPVTVTASATLAFGANGSLGTGAITLNAGTTLALTATGSTFTALTNEVTLPTGENEKATIRIDGARLKSGPQTILSNVAAGATANVELDMDSPALAGRKATLAVDGSNLGLTIEPNGTIMMVY